MNRYLLLSNDHIRRDKGKVFGEKSCQYDNKKDNKLVTSNLKLWHMVKKLN